MTGTTGASQKGGARGSARGAVLGATALNRATLARQLLLERAALGPVEAVERLVGLQAQAIYAPYTGLWTRLAAFRPESLGDLLTDRQVVRIAVMRGTVHLVSAADSLELRPLMQPLYDRIVTSNPPITKALQGLDLDKLAAMARELIDERPRTNAELRALLAEHWPAVDTTALSLAVRSRLACVQVPPRGVWGAKGQARLTTAEAWLGRPLSAEPSMAALVLRYLAAYGPASVLDMQTWSGLTRLGEVFEQVRSSLVVFRSDDGRELFDLPDAPRPSPEVSVPVRFLPEYDNLLRSHADRSRVMSVEARDRLASRNDSPRPTFLVDGFVQGGWRIEQKRGAAILFLEPFRRLSKRQAATLTSEGARLLTFTAPDATHDIRLAEPS